MLHPEWDWLCICRDGSLTDKNGNAGSGIYCKLFNFNMSLGQHATHFDGETVSLNTALIQVFDRIGSFEKAVIFGDSISATQSIATFYELPC